MEQQDIEDQLERKKVHSLELSRTAYTVCAFLVILLLVLACAITLMVEPGTLVIENGVYRLEPAVNELTRMKYILSPFLVLTPSNSNSATIWSIIILCAVLGGVFNAMDECGILVYLVEVLARNFCDKKYLLLFILSLCMMVLGTTIGAAEEILPLVPVVVLLFYALGWDTILALMSTVLSGCVGFTIGVINPFNTGIVQSLSNELVVYSGLGFRLALFIIYFFVLTSFIHSYARSIERNPQKSPTYLADEDRRKRLAFDIDTLHVDYEKNRALNWFGAVIGLLLIVAGVMVSLTVYYAKYEQMYPEMSWSPSRLISNLILYIFIAGYCIAGIGACVICRMPKKRLYKAWLQGTKTLLPACLAIMFASSIGYIFQEAHVTDTLLYHAYMHLRNMDGYTCILQLMGLLFILETFVPSASGKVLLIMPMVFRLCTMLGIDHHLAVLAFSFADGFANYLLPTSGGLLITLGMTPCGYGQWFRKVWYIFAVFFVMAIVALAAAYHLYM